MDEAIAVLKAEGAVIVDPADIPSVLEPDPGEELPRPGARAPASNNAKGKDATCSVVFKYGMKRDFNAWLATLGAAAPVKTLTELRLWNLDAHPQATPSSTGSRTSTSRTRWTSSPTRPATRPTARRTSRWPGPHGIDAVMKAQQARRAAVSRRPAARRSPPSPGYPTVIVPFGLVPNAPTPPFPAGFDAKPAPFGVSFTGLACSEPRLIEIAYAFEQATKKRVPPFAQ